MINLQERDRYIFQQPKIAPVSPDSPSSTLATIGPTSSISKFGLTLPRITIVINKYTHAHDGK